MQLLSATCYNWVCKGDDVFPAMLDAIHSAQRTIRLETYIYAPDRMGERFREALLEAVNRGVKVRVMVDALGSQKLPQDYWNSFIAAGGEARWFNPRRLSRFGFRDHRKLLVCDEEVAFVGGFNIASEYEGDGIKSGWFDIGLRITNTLAKELAASFDEMFEKADLQHKRFMRLRRSMARKGAVTNEGELLLCGPGRGGSPFKRALRRDLGKARDVKIIAAYFLPTRRIRRDLLRVVKRGGRVQLMLAAKTDVLLSQLAARSLYRRMLKAGIEIYEYQPQILHAKLIIIDDLVYVGSSNLDPRSLYINYELMLRFRNSEVSAGAQSFFADALKNCEQIRMESWKKARTWWGRLRQRWAYFCIARIDPFFARWQYKRMPN